MPVPESATQGARLGMPEASALARAPHFDLFLDREHARLRLARPLPCSFGTVEALTLDLGRLPPPLDLSLGAFGLRSRRRRVESTRLWIRADAVEAWAAERGARLSVDQASAEGVHITLLDEFGAVGVALDPRGDGPDLALRPSCLRARSGVRPPLERFYRQARVLGLAGGDDFRVSAPLFWLLAEALSAQGQRAPDIEALPELHVEPGEGGFWLTAPTPAGAPVAESAAAPLSIWPGALKDDTSAGREWWALEQELLRALRDADGEAAANAVSAMALCDPSPRLWAEAARLTAPLCGAARGAELLVRAAAHAGDDVPSLALAADAAAAAGPTSVFEVVEAIESSPCSDTLRGELMALALAGLRRDADEDDALDDAPLDDVDSRLADCVERALFLAPHSPDVRLFAGEIAADRGESAHALDHLRRAARGFMAAHRPTSSARASLRVAEILDQLERPGAAERVLVDARAETDDAPELVAALAGRWADSGLVQDAMRGYAALLRQPSGRDGLARALALGARYALRQGNVIAATPLVMRLLRDHPQGEAGARLREQLQQLEADVSHVNGPWDPDDPGNV